MWALGDYHRFATQLVWEVGPVVVEAAGIGPGMHVLDVAAGTGNVAVRAAEAGADVVASDLTPENLAAGRAAAEARGIELDWVEADAEALPFADGAFDAVTSAFGVMFAPDHRAAARELLRVCRPGGTIALASFTPDGLAGDFFAHARAPRPRPEGESPLRWGTEAHLRDAARATRSPSCIASGGATSRRVAGGAAGLRGLLHRDLRAADRAPRDARGRSGAARGARSRPARVRASARTTVRPTDRSRIRTTTCSPWLAPCRSAEHARRAARLASSAMKPFENEPILELRRAPVRARLDEAIREHDARPALQVPVWIGEDQRHGDELVSTDPGNPERVVATAAKATRGRRRRGAAGRAARLEGVGRDARRGAGARSWCAPPQWLRERRLEAAALAVRECAKPWPEADADVCEAIDFLEYYARGALDIAQGAPLLQVPGETNTLGYAPRGVVAVISPWNFPLAIPLGMVSAGLATGNSVVLKPAEQSPGCALMIFRALREARRAARRGVAAARRGRRRRRARQGPARAHDRLHGLGRRRAGDRARGGADAARARSTSSA